jgi:hypothetical protein
MRHEESGCVTNHIGQTATQAAASIAETEPAPQATTARAQVAATA